LAGIWGRWFLQIVGGSTEQGFFGLSDKISSISMIFTVSMLPIFMSEFSKAHGNSDFEKMRKLFQENAKLFYFLAAGLAIFFSLHTIELTKLLAGDEFGGAILPVAIMCLYPIHQTYAQMNGAVYYSSERTKIYRNIGIIFIVISVVSNYFFVAPAHFIVPGLGLGATGAAISSMLVVVLCTNWQLFFNCRYLKLRYREFFKHQIISILILLVSFLFGRIIIKTISAIVGINLGVWILIPSGILYCLLVAGAIFCAPRSTVGFDHERVKIYCRLFFKKINTIYKNLLMRPSDE
jgi:O-antigen/teichoic acid export membrane protein